MRRIWILIHLSCMAVASCFGQEATENPDIRIYTIPDSVVKKETISSGVEVEPFNRESSNGLVMAMDSLASLEIAKTSEKAITPLSFNQPGTAFIPLWRNGGLLATGERNVMPGLMQIDSGCLGLLQNMGNLSLYFGGVANKYGYFNGLHTQYGVNANISYSFSPRLSLVGFGTYYFGKPPLMANGMPMPPSMIGYFGVSTFGGYMNYQFNETFGLNVGGQAVQQFSTNKYRFEPIVTPTVKLGKVRIGLPVGQIMHGIIRTHMEGKRK